MIENFNFVTFLFFWTDILSSMDKIQKILQTKGTSFIQALTLLETLTGKLKVWRNESCNNVIIKAEQVRNEWGASIT